jgi:hypothetical protein
MMTDIEFQDNLMKKNWSYIFFLGTVKGLSRENSPVDAEIRLKMIRDAVQFCEDEIEKINGEDND